MGADVHRVGVVPTPALAFLAGSGDFAAGIMVSASHNPAEDNGLKVLDPAGLKLDDDVEDELEALVLRADELPGVAPGALGKCVDGHACWSAYEELDRPGDGRMGPGFPRGARHRERAAHRVGPQSCATGARVT
jgi:phosphoglucosamine mutase